MRHTSGPPPRQRLGSPPSTMTVSTSPAPLRRKAAARSYSGEVKQATPCSNVGNSITTKRWNLSGPSMIWWRPPRHHLAAELGDDARHEVGVLLVFDGIVDLRSGNPISRHGALLANVVRRTLSRRRRKSQASVLAVRLVLGTAKPYPGRQETADIARRGAFTCRAH